MQLDRTPLRGRGALRSRWGSDIASNWIRAGAAAPLPWLGWACSLILPAAVLLIVATAAWRLSTEDDLLEVVVTDASTGASLGGALVTIESRTYRSDATGTIRIDRPVAGTALVAEADGYRRGSGVIANGEASDAQRIALPPATLSGLLRDRASGQPIPEASLVIRDATGAEVARATSGADGAYQFADVPDGATIEVDAGAFGTRTEPVGDQVTRDFTFAVSRAEGRVLDANGAPLQGAIVHGGDRSSVSAGDGTFTIDGVADGVTLTVSATGHETAEARVAGGRVDDVRLSAQMIRGIYANWSLLTSPGGLDGLIEIANTTEINAIVIDIKQDTVYYDSKVPFFLDAGTVNPIMDVNEILNTLRANDIYAIARLVVFQDPLVAEARPDLAVRNENGTLWTNEMGVAWVNAFEEELWDANIALATEATRLGFDEIQYDYVRFPSDGDLTSADFGQEYSAEAREAAITAFMKRSSEAIHAEGGLLAADLFGFVTIVDDEQYIGQRFSALAPYLDYVCMMIYPSHFSEGNITSAPGHPNDYPYETIFESLERAEQNAPGSKAKFRPWLQDFSYGFNGLRDYTKDDVRAQIEAAETFGASGWLLWGDPFNVTVEALAPETGT